MNGYKGENTGKISFPLGGIGSGAIGLSGAGRLIDWEIFNRPAKLSYNGMSHFAVKAELGGRVVDVRALNGGYFGDLTGASKTFGFGPPRESLAGIPHFRDWEFQGEFPFAKLVFTDPDFPGKVTLTAFNPFIPLNAKDSSVPCALFEVEFANDGPEPIDYTLCLVVANPWKKRSRNEFSVQDGMSRISLKNCAGDLDAIDYGDICLSTDCPDVSHQENWFRGSWFDSLGVYWRELQTPGALKPRGYGVIDDATLPGGIADSTAHAALAAHLHAGRGESVKTRMAICWHIPNCRNYWDDKLEESELVALGLENHWKNYYTTQWSDSMACAAYVTRNWNRLAADSMAFMRALHDSTIPPVFVEAASATLSVLKSPTCLRLEDGSFYAFEGCTVDHGCCEGSCTHVWNYAYALPYLFPELERSMRELEYRHNLGPHGEMPFRLMLPLGRESHYRPCADGQFGTIVKVYREWKRSGDVAWLKKLWPGVKSSLEYAWSPDNEDRWDPERLGVLTGRQHHTLDMELFGANSWLTGLYLAALKAAAAMAEQLGEHDSAALYLQIFQRGQAILNSELFNGEYFQQRLDLKDRDILAPFAASTGCANKKHKANVYESYWDAEHQEIKYQIGDGCEIDQLLGQWHANLTGLGDIFDRDKARSALRAIFRHNYKQDMRKHFNPCRIFCIEDESGTVMCEWPEGRYKPWVPLTYAEETMHGFEYALAGQMIQYGMLEEAARVVKAVRDRYDGRKRNPWNEIECGSNYARSLAAFALVAAYSGFQWDARTLSMAFAPADAKPLRCFWATNTAWGVFHGDGDVATLEIRYGTLELKTFSLRGAALKAARLNGAALEASALEDILVFAPPCHIEANGKARLTFTTCSQEIRP